MDSTKFSREPDLSSLKERDTQINQVKNERKGGHAQGGHRLKLFQKLYQTPSHQSVKATD